MLSIGKLAAGQESYYLDSVASGIEDYYTGAGEAPGRWVGAAAQDLGLAGEVAAEDLRAVIAGLDPITGTRLARANRKLPGFDLTFSAPKSVSVLWALATPATSAAVVEAHEAAVEAALGYLEREAAVVRRGRNGVHQLPASGLVAAAFRHRTSRAGDPQLHTHLVVANAGRGPDGRWGALDGRLLYGHARTAGFLYRAQLRHELTTRVDVSWDPPKRGIAEIAGLPAPLLRLFSRRRVEIEEALADRGLSSADASRVATLATRRTKDRGVDGDSLRDQWRTRAAEAGFAHVAPFELTSANRADPERGLPAPHDEFIPEPGEFGAVPCELPAQEELISTHQCVEMGSFVRWAEPLTEHDSTFNRRDALQAAATDASQGATVEQLEAAVDAFLICGQVVSIGDDLYTTPEILDMERHILAAAEERRAAGVATVADATIQGVWAERPTLSLEQRTMVRRLTQSGAGVEVVAGRAGAGKTFALDAARAAWAAENIAVIGCALSARAAAELQAGSGITSATIDALLGALDHPEGHLPTRAVVIVDEAGMVDTRRLSRLVTHINRANGKLVLVGDPRQLPEIGPGGVFAALPARIGAVELVENRRQRHPGERHAVVELREGRAAKAIERLSQHGRVVTAATAPAARARLVGDWLAARDDGQDAVMIASRHKDVNDLNDTARQALLHRGDVAGPAVDANGRHFAAGDRVMALRNNRRLGLTNGHRGTVLAAHVEAHGLSVAWDTGTTTVVPRAYLQAGHLTHGYALTIHKAQGMTCDAAFVLGDDRLYAEAGYTALTRARHQNRLYAVTTDHDRDEDHHGPPAERDPVQAVVEALSRSRVKQLATSLARNAPSAMTDEDLRAALAKITPKLAKIADARRDHDSGRRRFDRASDDLAEARRALHRAAEAAQRARRLPVTPKRRRLRDETRHELQDAEQRTRLAMTQYEDARRSLEQRAKRRDTLASAETILTMRERPLRAELEQRASLAAQHAIAAPPPRYTQLLGDRPTDTNRAREWNRAVATLEHYRITEGIDVTPDTFPTIVQTSRQKMPPSHERQIVDTIHQARRTTGVDRGPDPGRDYGPSIV